MLTLLINGKFEIINSKGLVIIVQLTLKVLLVEMILIF